MAKRENWVRLDIAPFCVEVFRRTDEELATWTRQLAECLAYNNPDISEFGAAMLDESYGHSEVRRAAANARWRRDDAKDAKYANASFASDPMQNDAKYANASFCNANTSNDVMSCTVLSCIDLDLKRKEEEREEGITREEAQPDGIERRTHGHPDTAPHGGDYPRLHGGGLAGDDSARGAGGEGHETADQHGAEDRQAQDGERPPQAPAGDHQEAPLDGRLVAPTAGPVDAHRLGGAIGRIDTPQVQAVTSEHANRGTGASNFAHPTLGIAQGENEAQGAKYGRRKRKCDIDEPNDPDFNRWWAEYPRKDAKIPAIRAWEGSRRHMPPIDDMIDVLTRQIAANDWGADQARRRYTPLPASYINARRWTDEPAPRPTSFAEHMASSMDEINERHRALGAKC